MSSNTWLQVLFLYANFPSHSTSPLAKPKKREHLFLVFGVLLRSIDQQVANAARVTPLIVVPSDELDKVRVQLDTRGSIEDGRGRVTNKISRDNGIVGVFNDALELSLSGCLDGRLDVVV